MPGKGLWHNIRAKRERVGKDRMAKSGDKGYKEAVIAANNINKKTKYS